MNYKDCITNNEAEAAKSIITTSWEFFMYIECRLHREECIKIWGVEKGSLMYRKLQSVGSSSLYFWEMIDNFSKLILIKWYAQREI
jgi:hypothetical protein